MSGINRVLVTGASGFIGASVVRRLASEGREIAILLRPASNTSRISAQLASVHCIEGDLFKLADVAKPVADFRPEAVLHLGWSGVKAAERNMASQVDNVHASVALQRLAMDCGSTVFVGLGSQAEYGPCSGRIDETVATRPTTVYGAAKLSTCVLLDRIASAQGHPVAWLRLFSSYGPGDDPSWLLQYVARSLLLRQRPALTAAQQMWDYIHVDDVASAVIATMDAQVQGVFNLGSGTACKLEKTINSLRDLIDPGLPLGIGELPYRPDQVMHLEADISKLTRATGWTPQVPLDEGLRQVVEWLRENS